MQFKICSRFQQRGAIQGEASEANPAAVGPERADPLPGRGLRPAAPRLAAGLPPGDAPHQKEVKLTVNRDLVQEGGIFRRTILEFLTLGSLSVLNVVEWSKLSLYCFFQIFQGTISWECCRLQTVDWICVVIYCAAANSFYLQIITVADTLFLAPLSE